MTIIDFQTKQTNQSWTVEQSRLLYRIKDWSEGYFDINNNGHVITLPHRDKNNAIDIYELAKSVKQNGQSLPLLLRFTNILHDRVNDLCQAFENAKNHYGYKADYTVVYPVKVNQQRRVIEATIDNNNNVGLEAGSKPELLSIIALATKSSIVICNGYKDKEYIRLALIGQQLGLKVYIVIEKLSELSLILDIAKEMDIRPRLGIRIRLSSIAKGNWQNTGGEKSKFGLHTAQIINAINHLRATDFLQCLELLHFHIGSQVSNIQDFKRALNEGVRFYSELREMDAPVDTVDVGGGLGIDYEGSQSCNFSSVNYTMQSYADTVIHAFSDICREHKLTQPAILSESGRSIAAHHAVLVTEVIDVEQVPGLISPPSVKPHEHQKVKELWSILQEVNENNACQSYYEANNYHEETKEMFVHGILDLKQRSRIEEIYFSVCRKVWNTISDDQYEIKNELNEILADKYFCNFSLFQSMPDSWAIDQVFPIMPLHRLDEQPDKRGTIQDLTCDSDGRVNLYVEHNGIQSSLPVHRQEQNNPYLIGVFLIGAYQEILGDMHNLFGDTASVNIEVTPDGKYHLSEFHPGDTVANLLEYIHIDPQKLKLIFKQKVDSINIQSELQTKYLNELTDSLTGYTYLED